MFKIGILGATGIVGQKLITLLINHPWFEISTLGASPKNSGKRLGELCNIDNTINDFILKPCIPTFFSNCDLIFSCLKSNISNPIEKTFLEFGFLLISNCSNYRLHPSVPLVVPTVNPFVLNNLKFRNPLKIITNANCSTTGIVTILQPLDLKYGIKQVFVTTMQAISGAGKYYDESINNNVIPFIKKEEEKIQTETLKILEKNQDDFSISATCNRVPVSNGHTVCMSISFNNKPTITEVINCLESYNAFLIKNLNTPSSSNKNFIKIIMDNDYRPQPLLDVDNSDGFCVTVGRIRKCNVFDIKLTIHFNNLIIGAAGSTLLNAELYYKNNVLNS